MENINKKEEICYEVYVDGQLWNVYDSYEEANDVAAEMGDYHDCFVKIT